MILPGRLDRRVMFLRRAKGATLRDRGEFQDLFEVWGDYRRLSGREALEAGRETNVEEGTLRVRWPGKAAEITIADRVVIDGRERAIVAVGTPDHREGSIEFSVRSDVKS